MYVVEALVLELLVHLFCQAHGTYCLFWPKYLMDLSFAPRHQRAQKRVHHANLRYAL